VRHAKPFHQQQLLNGLGVVVDLDVMVGRWRASRPRQFYSATCRCRARDRGALDRGHCRVTH
jgi:hypothetical protein